MPIYIDGGYGGSGYGGGGSIGGGGYGGGSFDPTVGCKNCVDEKEHLHKQIPTAELTQVALDGNGVFDQLMQATAQHLKEEFDKGRIRGTEYAQAYTQALATVMQQSLEFLLQREKNVWEVDVLKATVCKVQQEYWLLCAQTQQTHEVTAKTIAETDALYQQMQHAADKHPQEMGILSHTIAKLMAEESLLRQKLQTEIAQVTGDPNWLWQNHENSVIGRQKALYKAQTEGFARDAEQKAAKIFTDAIAVSDGIEQVGTFGSGGTGLTSANAQKAINKLLNGIGV